LQGRCAPGKVVIGGFHVCGVLAMLPQRTADLQEALDIGCTLFAGEAEGRIDEVLRDAAAGTLKPIYNYMSDLPALESAPTPYLPPETVGRVVNHHASFDAGRGCPFQCSFCTIINVQGRKSRRRSPDDVEQLIKRHWAAGIRRFSSPTIISPATRTGSLSSIALFASARWTRSTSTS
jgi:radical SAM superfamily enzyme YgiQ (UPF0313 family)